MLDREGRSSRVQILTSGTTDGEYDGRLEALGVVHPGAQLAAEHLALAVAQPAVEVVPAVLRPGVHGVRGERRLLHVVEGSVSQFRLERPPAGKTKTIHIGAPGFFFFFVGQGDVSAEE
ncbi:hypothetical protein EYF80_033369 [Liparis tanakae]|uniref:Uncharacterized protein n=1 Tax=Liparis tanakae TaxID=230148 RepID=A0A4Z2GRX3_9TELE|nr:hypothetical protein EYF80_033369 [Liparis tanakae]